MQAVCIIAGILIFTFFASLMNYNYYDYTSAFESAFELFVIYFMGVVGVGLLFRNRYAYFTTFAFMSLVMISFLRNFIIDIFTSGVGESLLAVLPLYILITFILYALLTKKVRNHYFYNYF
jgi:hypothetical protein